MSQKPDVKIFKAYRGDSIPKWIPLIEELNSRGYHIHRDAQPADVSIVLSGQFENPLALTGKRVIAFVQNEWKPSPFVWRFMGTVLEHYYHAGIDLSGTKTPAEAADKITSYIEKQLTEC